MTSRIHQGHHKNLAKKRALRSEMTRAERKLWFCLRGKQLAGLKFRRQHGIGPYIVDFYCPEKLIVVEVDGDIHGEHEQISRDSKREEFLKDLGLKIVRYSNSEVLNNVEGVVEDLSIHLRM